MRKIRNIGFIACCVVVAAASQLGPPAATAQQGGQVRGDLGREMLQLVNDERAARGIDPLTWDGELADLADEWSARMARERRLRHRLRGGDTPELAAGFTELVENVSMNSAGQIGRSHALMTASDAHRANLLHPGVTKGGIGVVCDADGAVWITQYFASGPDEPFTEPSPGAPPSEPTVHDRPDAGGSCADPPPPDPAGPDGDGEGDVERDRDTGGDGVERERGTDDDAEGEPDTAGDPTSSDGDGTAGDPDVRDAPRTDDDRSRAACPEGRTPAARFADREAIPASHRANVDCAVWHAVVSGYPDGYYRPSLPVRRDQMATFLVNTLAVAGVELPAPSERRFHDLEGSPHAPAAHRLAAAGIVAGGPQDLPAGAYGPGLTVRRDQLASFLVRALDFAGGGSAGGDDQAGATRSFRDVPAGNAHSDNVDAAASAGLVAGFADGRYRPAGDVRRDQTATFVVRLLTR